MARAAVLLPTEMLNWLGSADQFIPMSQNARSSGASSNRNGRVSPGFKFRLTAKQHFVQRCTNQAANFLRLPHATAPSLIRWPRQQLQVRRRSRHAQGVF